MAEIISTPTSLIGSGSAAQGFSFPLSGNAVFNPTYTAEEVIRTNLINWLLTNKGERVFRPNFGLFITYLILNIGIEDEINISLQ